MEIRHVYCLSQPNTVLQIVMVYRQTFGDYPWYEGYICPVCKFITPITERTILCPRCQEEGGLINMVEFWPESRVMTDFYGENLKEGAICFEALDGVRTIGFAWGYPMEINQESANKIEAPDLTKIYLQEVFYLDECAVLPVYQGRGIGKGLVEKILKEQPYDLMILRTLEGSPMQHLVEKLGGRKLMSISEGRVIMELIKWTSLYKFVTPDHY